MRRAMHAVRHSRGARTTLVTLFSLCLMVPAAPASAASGTGISSTTENELQRFALSLVNCTRTGGWVQSNGSCTRKPKDRNKRSVYRPPLKLHDMISEKVAETLAVRCVRRGRCGHYVGPHYTTRFRRVGIKGHIGEALGYGWHGTMKRSIISSFRIMQQEKLNGNWGRWHWRYIKEKDFRKVGIGVAKRGSYTVIVYDFAS